MKKINSKNITVITVLSIVIILISACEQPAAPSPVVPQKPRAPAGPVSGGVLKIIEQMTAATPIGYPPETIGGSSMFSRMALETLVAEDDLGRIIPVLAESWLLAPDKKSITFNLRKGVKFHDGTDFNADAVKWNFELAKTAKKSGTNMWQSIDVIDDYTLRIALSQYENSLLNNMAGAGCLIISPTAFKTKGIDAVRWNPIGTGPFKFVSFDRDVSVKFTKNEAYWDKGKPYLDGIEFTFIVDQMTASAAFQAPAGGFHVMRNNWDKIGADLIAAGFTSIGAPTGATAMFPDSMNADSPLANKKVREAIEYAIDKDSIVKAKGYGFWKSSYQVAPDVSMAYNSAIQGRKYDPTKAKQLLTEAGYPNGFKITITPDVTSIDRDVMISIQAFLKTIGIDANVDFVEFSKYSSMRTTSWKNGFLCGALGIYANYTMGMQLYFLGTQYPSMTKSQDIVNQINLALAASDYDTQKSLTQKASQIISDDEMLISIYTVGMGYFIQKGYQLNDSGFLKRGSWPVFAPQNAWLVKK